MLLRPATYNYGRNIGPLFRIVAAKFQNTKFRALPHSDSGNGPLPLLRVQLRPLPPLFITLVATRLHYTTHSVPRIRINVRGGGRCLVLLSHQIFVHMYEVLNMDKKT
jgi:hypothetical protein